MDMHKLLRIMREADERDRSIVDAVFSGREYEMGEYAAGILTGSDLNIIDISSSDDEGIAEYTVQGTPEALRRAAAHLEDLQSARGGDWYGGYYYASESDYEDDDYEDDGQPSSYEEYQDLYGGDDWDHGQFDEGQNVRDSERKDYGKKDIRKAEANKKRRENDKKEKGVKEGKGINRAATPKQGQAAIKRMKSATAAKNKKKVKESAVGGYGCTSGSSGSTDENVSFTQTKNQGSASVTVSANANSMEVLQTMLKLAGIKLPNEPHEEPDITVVEPVTQVEPNTSDAKASLIDKLQKSLSQKFNL